MSFDALTISGLLVAIVSGGFLLGVVWNNQKTSGQQQVGRGDGGSGPLGNRG